LIAQGKTAKSVYFTEEGIKTAKELKKKIKHLIYEESPQDLFYLEKLLGDSFGKEWKIWIAWVFPTYHCRTMFVRSSDVLRTLFGCNRRRSEAGTKENRRTSEETGKNT
jgi:hypothetical protein